MKWASGAALTFNARSGDPKTLANSSARFLPLPSPTSLFCGDGVFPGLNTYVHTLRKWDSRSIIVPQREQIASTGTDGTIPATKIPPLSALDGITTFDGVPFNGHQARRHRHPRSFETPAWIPMTQGKHVANANDLACVQASYC